jgi:hypothetical protein
MHPLGRKVLPNPSLKAPTRYGSHRLAAPGCCEYHPCAASRRLPPRIGLARTLGVTGCSEFYTSAMKAFISYTREKNAHDKFVSKFRDHLETELRLRKRTSSVFMDESGIRPGSSFPSALDAALKDSDVLITLLSPAWFESSWCRRELERFVDFKSEQGRFPAVLPLLWVPVDLDTRTADKLAQFLAPIQYLDWTDLRKRRWGTYPLKDATDRLAQAMFALAEIR